MITDATLTQNLESKSRNLEVREKVLNKPLWVKNEAIVATSAPVKAHVGGVRIPLASPPVFAWDLKIASDFRFLR